MATPRFYLWVYETNNGIGHPGSASNEMVSGWQHVLDAIITPQLTWFDQIGEAVGIVVHVPHGNWTHGDMGDFIHADALDYCIAANAGFFLSGFQSVWETLNQQRHCIAYVGGIHKIAHLQDKTPKELGEIIDRNYKTYAYAGFPRICIDTAGDAITHNYSFTGITITGNNEIIGVNFADNLFSGQALIEATPRNSFGWAQLTGRDCVIREDTWRTYHGTTGEMLSNATDIGYGDRSYLGGGVHRIVSHAFFSPGTGTLAAGQRVISEGDNLILDPASLIASGIDATGLL